MTGTATPTTAIALFDLDGTITYRDTLFDFVSRFIASQPARLLRTPAIVAALAVFACDGRDRGRLKAQVLHAVLGGVRRAEIDAFATRFAAALEASGRLRPGALAALAAHRGAGERLVLLSASPDIYVPHIGRLLGFERIICTELRWRGDLLDGALATPNRRGQEKARCLERLRAEFPGAPVTAYGNACSDIAHLALAERGVLVNANASARKRGARAGLSIEDWP